jgi:hypothetical protein
MKTHFAFALATAITILFLVSFQSSFASNRNCHVSQHSLATKFFGIDTILVVLPDEFTLTEPDKNNIESHTLLEDDQNKPAYIYKHESDVNALDVKKHILFYGAFHCFQRKEFLRIPVKKHGNGFYFNNTVYNQPIDAFFYVNQRANRMYICKNSEKGRHEFFSVGAGAYPLHIFRGTEVLVTGVYL